MTKDEKLDTAYSLKTPDDSRKLYGDWAESYEEDFVETSGYILHIHVARAFSEAGGEGPVLDVGAGTGLVGEALAQFDPGEIDGTDISPEMLQQAAEKGVYRALFPGDILAGLGLPDGVYSGVVSAGTFTLGHVGPDGLDEVVRLLTSGGLAVIAVRDAHFTESGFEQKIAELEPVLSEVGKTSVRIYAEGADGPHADDQAILLHLWKA
ncbi:class I SAM-dependent methyltransferase [Aliishimia ponticola]|uniref:Class I SAM-dependent methyltransferase n=1 Tax=Aliishimia ponticola TaxID=2499833 RepID=A0A4V6S201_9RHOB|nr:class I SAM-dependent methyltransferase [Aliishimia ponticola]THH34753.1 class I SAM-dependent methyltransferase [Aliishimia ponticola]